MLSGGRVNDMPRLIGCIRWPRLEPKSISAKVDLIRPIEATPALADPDAREKRGIGEGGKDALAHQITKIMHGLRAGCPGDPDRERVRLGLGLNNDVFHGNQSF